jgi:cell division ATPase FtsA
MPGLTELAKQELKLSSQIGFASGVGKWAKEGGASMDEYLEDPEFTTALGLLLEGMRQEGWEQREKESISALLTSKGLKGLFRSFLP